MNMNYNAYVRLTVKTRSGKTHRFTENSGLKMQDIEHYPDLFKPQLMQLCDFVNKEMGERS